MATVIRGDDNFDTADAGKVLQVVEAQASGSLTSPTTSFADVASSSITITPSSTSSKILLMWNTGGMSNGSNNAIKFKVIRGSTQVRGMSRFGYSAGTWNPMPISIQYLDSPATTAAVTYKLQAKEIGSATMRVNQDGSSKMILMEIQG